MKTLSIIFGILTIILMLTAITRAKKGRQTRRLVWATIGTTILFVLSTILRFISC